MRALCSAGCSFLPESSPRTFRTATSLYSRITPPPLGYLLHHRGHTHTLVGCAVLGLCGWLVTRLIPPVRRLDRRVTAAILDARRGRAREPRACSTPGTATAFIRSGRSTIVGITATRFTSSIRGSGFCSASPSSSNARSTTRRIVLGAGLIALPLALVWFRMIPSGALVALAVIGAGLGLATHRAMPRVRSAAALSAVVVFVTAMFGLSHVARGVSLASLRTIQGAEESGDIVDVVLNPNPAVPVCWTALAIEKRESRDEYILRRGNVSLFDGWLPARVCANSGAVAGSSRSRAEWSVSSRQSLSRLRTRSRDDCWVRGWLQFGRAPAMTNDHIADYRFGGAEGGNFTSMRVVGLDARQGVPAASHELGDAASRSPRWSFRELACSTGCTLTRP